MNSENKTPQEELLEEVKEQEAAAEAASQTEPETETKEESKEEPKTDEEKTEKKDKKEGKKPKKESALKKFTSSRKFRRGGMATAFTAVFVVVVILVNVVVSLLSERFPSMNLDLTANQVNTLSEEALDVAKNEVNYDTTLYLVLTDSWVDYAAGYGYPYSTLLSLSDKLAEANSKIKVEQIDLEKNPTFVNQYANESISNGCVVVESEKRSRVLGISDMFPAETNQQTGSSSVYNNVDAALASAIKQVNLEEVPVVSIATGHDELLTSQLESLTAFFEDNTFEVKQFNILTEEIPENTQLLFLPTPNTDYTDEELSKLDAFLANEESTKSRTLLFTSNPGQADLPKLNAFLAEWGIGYDPTSVVMESDSSRYLFNSPLYYISDKVVDEEAGVDVIEGDYSLLLTPSSVPVEQLFEANNSIVTYPILTTSESAYLQKTEDLSDKTTEDVQADAENADKKAYYTGMVARKALDTTGSGNYANVIVLGSSAMITSTYLNTNTFSNGTYFSNVVKYATNTTSTDNTVYSPKTEATTYDMTATTSVVNFLGLGLFTITIPVVILLAGLVIYFKRRHL